MKRGLTVLAAAVFLSFFGCGGGSSGSCPDVQDAEDAGVFGADSVVNCEGCSSGSESFTCESDSLTVECEDGQIAGSFASTSDCTEGTVTCFNGAINTSCIDTASE